MKKRPITSLTRWEDVEKRLLKNKAFYNASKKLESEFELTRSLIELRLKKNISQAELAKKIGTKQPVISRLENMTSKPSLSLLEKISQALNVRLRVYFQS